jgi:hypothetical protein
MPLCTQADIEVLRQIDVTAEPDPTITALIRHAEGIIEGLSGRRFDEVADLELLVEDAPEVDGMVYLPHFPVTAVAMALPDATVLEDGTNFAWGTKGVVYHLGFGTGVMTWDWQYHVPRVGLPWMPGTTITYSGGAGDPDDPDSLVPQDLRTVCAQIAAMLYDAGAAGSPGIQSESLGGWSVSYAAGVADNLSKYQMAVIRRYSHRMPVIAY